MQNMSICEFKDVMSHHLLYIKEWTSGGKLEYRGGKRAVLDGFVINGSDASVHCLDDNGHVTINKSWLISDCGELFFNTIFRNCEFIGLKFIDISWEDSIAQNCKFDGCTFQNINMQNCIWENNILNETFFYNCKMDGVVMTKSIFSDSHIRDTICDTADFGYSKFNGIAFINNDFRGSMWYEAQFKDFNTITNCDFRSSYFGSSNIAEVSDIGNNNLYNLKANMGYKLSFDFDYDIDKWSICISSDRCKKSYEEFDDICLTEHSGVLHFSDGTKVRYDKTTVGFRFYIIEYGELLDYVDKDTLYMKDGVTTIKNKPIKRGQINRNA